MAWHGYRARNNDEWHHRKEIAKEFEKLQAARGNSYDAMQSGMSDYDAAARKVINKVMAKRRKLPAGHARVYEGNKLIYSR